MIPEKYKSFRHRGYVHVQSPCQVTKHLMFKDEGFNEQGRRQEGVFLCGPFEPLMLDPAGEFSSDPAGGLSSDPAGGSLSKPHSE